MTQIPWQPVVVFAILLAVLVLLATRLARIVGRQAGGGGWGALAARYATTRRQGIPGALRRRSVKVGNILWRNCITVAALDDGLYLEMPTPLPFMSRPPLLVPWRDIRTRSETLLFWREALLLRIGDPEVGTVTLGSDCLGLVSGRPA